jgi:signal transduction histidine kinase
VSARAKGVELRRETDGPSPVVEVAAPEMIRVLRNLLDNAIRHSEAGSRVTVHTTVDEVSKQAFVSVRDSCGGIPDSEIGRVFETGYRGDEARTPGAGRGGLGLAVAQGLVHAHAGRITVQNELGGCRFTVSVPIRSG